MKSIDAVKRAIVIGATSGIGREVARLLAADGWKVGVAGRRLDLLQSLQSEFDEGQVVTAELDVTLPESVNQLHSLIERLGGMDLFFLSSGVGSQNVLLDSQIELGTVKTNCEGFVRMLICAYDYFKIHATSDRRGHVAVISSIAGTKGLGVAPAYSATKRFQNTYVEALNQLANMEHLAIDFTDIRPGFVATPLLSNKRYPMLMKADFVAQSIVKALYKRKRVCVIDIRYRLLVLCWKLIPNWIWIRLKVKN